MPSLRDLITDPGLELTPSERKVIRALLDQYPRNGLGPMSRLAEHAGVSDPTIVRMVKKLGPPLALPQHLVATPSPSQKR